MATMRVKEETPTKLVLENARGGLVSLTIILVSLPPIGILLFNLRSSYLFWIVAVIGFIIVSLFVYNALHGWTITLDQESHVVTRTERFFGKPSKQTQMSFEQVERIVVSQIGISLESKQHEQLPIGSSMAQDTNGELISLEPKLAFFLNKTAQVDTVGDSLWKPYIQAESPLQLVLEGEGHLHERWILDKASKTVIRTKTLLGATSLTTANYPFSSIKQVEVELQHFGTVLFLGFESGARVQIAHSRESLQELARKCGSFLQVEVRETITD